MRHLPPPVGNHKPERGRIIPTNFQFVCQQADQLDLTRHAPNRSEVGKCWQSDKCCDAGSTMNCAACLAWSGVGAEGRDRELINPHCQWGRQFAVAHRVANSLQVVPKRGEQIIMLRAHKALPLTEAAVCGNGSWGGGGFAYGGDWSSYL